MRQALLILAFLLFAAATVIYVLERAFAPACVSGGLCAAAAVWAFKISDS